MVALSGYSCLGFDNAPFVRLTSWRKLLLGREFDCPRIHFVSGMTLHAHDPSQAILAYGVNDCLSRFVSVQVSDLSFDVFFCSLVHELVPNSHADRLGHRGPLAE